MGVGLLEFADGLVLQLEELAELGQVEVFPLLDEGVGLVRLSAPAGRSLLAASWGLWSGWSGAGYHFWMKSLNSAEKWSGTCGTGPSLMRFRKSQ